MAPKPSKIGLRNVPGNSVSIRPNIDTTCFTIYDHEDDDMIHICDWPKFKEAVDKLMADREAE